MGGLGKLLLGQECPNPLLLHASPDFHTASINILFVPSDFFVTLSNKSKLSIYKMSVQILDKVSEMAYNKGIG